MLQQNLNFNLFNILILIGIFQGFVFCFIVFGTKKYRFIPNYFLAFTALSLSLSNFQYLLIDIGFVKKLFFQLPFEFLIMPMFYLFVDRYLQIESKKRFVTLILIPFILSLLFRLILTFGFITISEATTNFLLTTEEYLSLIFSIFLIVSILYKIYLYEKSKTDFDILKIRMKTKWLKQALIIGIVVCAFWTFVIKDQIARLGNDLSAYYPLWISISILVYWIVYKGMVETAVFKQREDIRQDTIKAVAKPISKNKIKDDLFFEIKNTIIQDKLYLNSNLNLDLIAEKFNISSGFLSRLINSNADQSFTDFINHLRIEESKKMLLNPNYKNYTIEAIGSESGFNSKSNFYAAFKKETNKTPSKYRINP